MKIKFFETYQSPIYEPQVEADEMKKPDLTLDMDCLPDNYATEDANIQVISF